MKIEGAVVLVTGGANGIGKAIGFALLSKQAKVCVADYITEDGQKTVDEFKKQFGDDSAIFVKCDVRSLRDVQDAFKETVKTFGQVNIVANNAGIADEVNYENLVNINVTGVMRVLQTALGHMDMSKGGKGGTIINTASFGGLIVGHSVPAYFATKHAVVAYTRCFAMPFHYEKHSVRINCLCPHMTDTGILKWNSTKCYVPEELNRKVKEEGTMNMAQWLCKGLPRDGQWIDGNGVKPELHVLRKGQPEDVATAFVDLVEDDSKNGEAIVLRLGHAPLSYQFPPPFTV